MSDLSPEELITAAQRLGRDAGRVLMALQSDAGTPVVMMAPTLESLSESIEALLTTPQALIRYDPEQDAATLQMLSSVPTYVPSSPAELESDFTAADRHELSGLLTKFLFSDTFPGNPIDHTRGTLSASIHQIVDHLEGIER